MIPLSSTAPDTGEEQVIFGEGFDNDLVVITRRIMAAGPVSVRDTTRRDRYSRRAPKNHSRVDRYRARTTTVSDSIVNSAPSNPPDSLTSSKPASSHSSRRAAGA